MSSYVLSPHAHACVTSDYAVILDLRRDAYLALGASHLPALQALIADWPREQTVRHSCSSSADIPIDLDQLAHELRTRHLITTDRSKVTVRDVTAYCRPVRTLLEPRDTKRSLDETEPHALRQWRLTMLFAWSYAKALAQLKVGSLEHAVSHFRRLKFRTDRAAERDVRALVASFARLRTFAYTKSDACLVDSVTLMHFLAHYAIRPMWVLGVATGPFVAHSWVQLGETLLNDTIEHVSQFVPILVV